MKVGVKLIRMATHYISKCFVGFSTISRQSTIAKEKSAHLSAVRVALFFTNEIRLLQFMWNLFKHKRLKLNLINHRFATHTHVLYFQLIIRSCIDIHSWEAGRFHQSFRETFFGHWQTFDVLMLCTFYFVSVHYLCLNNWTKCVICGNYVRTVIRHSITYYTNYVLSLNINKAIRSIAVTQLREVSLMNKT